MKQVKESRPKAHRINPFLLKQSLKEGATLEDAAKAAGSKGKSKSALRGAAYKVLERHPGIKEDVVNQYQKRRQWVFDALNSEKIKKMNGYQLTIMLATLTDKIQLLNNLPTQRIHGDLDVKNMTQDQIRHRLLSTITNKDV